MKILDVLKQDLSQHSLQDLIAMNGNGRVSQQRFECASNDIKTAHAEAKAWIAENMPVTDSYLTDPVRYNMLAQMLVVAAKAVNEGEIENARYNDWKAISSSLLSHITSAQKKLLDEQYWHIWVAYRERHPYNNDQVLGSAHFDSLHDIKAYHKTLLKWQNKQDQLIEYERLQYADRLALLTELLLLNETNAYLKTIIVKTVRKAAAPKDNQGEQMTCGYCFRQIRYMPKSQILIAYHGYQRDSGYGAIIAGSCGGSSMPPLEASHHATFKLLEDLIHQKASIRMGITELENKLQAYVDVNEIELPVEERKQVTKMRIHLTSYRRDLSHYIPDTENRALEKLRQFHPDKVDLAQQIIRSDSVEA